jgi:hypothetical protein
MTQPRLTGWLKAMALQMKRLLGLWLVVTDVTILQDGIVTREVIISIDSIARISVVSDFSIRCGHMIALLGALTFR